MPISHSPQATVMPPARAADPGAPARVPRPSSAGAADALPALRPRTAPDALAGFTIGVTADRGGEELAALLERRGARVVRAPAIRLVPLPDDAPLLAATLACLDAPVHDVVVTTGAGFRGWMAAADGWGLGAELTARLSQARLLCRGPKSRGAVRAAGLAEHRSPPADFLEDIERYLLDQDLRGRRVVLQPPGEPLAGLAAALRAAGATVIEAPVYRWTPSRDPSPLHRLIVRTIAGSIDAIAFTSAPAVRATLDAARAGHLEEPLLTALAGSAVAACVGPVTAAPLRARGVPVVQPGTSRLGALAHALAGHLPEHGVTRLTAGAHRLEIRGHAVAVDGELQPLPPAPMAVLKRLAERPGHVVSRAELRVVLPGGPERDSAEHAVEMAVTRLRRALGRAGIVETVVKRGYRLACDRRTAAAVRTARPKEN
ncbi:uroporphyrinogen III methyltransferase [Sphaerisporangium krabiense]|uniref:Uroporphyrinogen-III synthase n=1 Tax=Sphaerisporangium krabiense TaxID=763782 RepID=A0A7W8ZCG3_9ACTN|nr:uroporphyrinogen-III synthase [Sphaerisporangium krabiense]MBB5631123.1 uroporphyrinogen-III synthase [Sphaerisporangium krabiense]GII66009.1 uroporphyrinogen III methyltransferase [Sphaerisporangium krabiense]